MIVSSEHHLFPGVEISLGYQEPALSLSRLILTAVLVDVKPMHKTLWFCVVLN